LDSIFENTKFPISMIFGFGTLTALIGIGLAALSVLNYFYGNAPFSGFVAIFSSIMILGGLQIFLLGLIGQFVYRTFEISRERPLFVIKRIL
jgi:dolichol-phosphate mannosyltransferase